MRELKANTQVIVTVGPFVDVGDGFTPQTDIALSGNEAELIKHGVTSVTSISGATWAPVTNCRGHYSLTLTASHTNTPGNLRIVVQDDSDCLPVVQDYMVLGEFEWDRKYGTAGVNSGRLSGVQWYGTFASIAATTITLPASHNLSEGRVMVILDGGTTVADGRGKSRIGTLATNTITVDPGWETDSETRPTTLTGQVISIPKSPTSSTPTVALADGHLVAAKFGADCITNAKIADDAIAAENLATGAITADAYAADAIVAATLATGAISADAFAADAIVAATLATGAISADAFAADALVAGTFATGALGADAFAADAIADTALAADTVTKITDDIFAEVFAGATTFTQLCRGLEAVLLGKVSGMESNAPVFRDRADTMPVVTATTDADGNRTAVTLDLDDTP